jgi:2-methylcitrate dehydratase PrpD
VTGKHAQQLLHLYDAWNDASLSAHSREVARMGILDCVGCIVAGTPTPAARMVRELATEQGVVAQSSVLGTRLKLSPPLAALANGVAGHVLDYDDMSSTLLGHPSVVLVPAIFALAEARQKSGREAVCAFVLGFEVDTWFGRLMIPRHYDAGWHATSSLGIFGATAAASRLLGLDARGMLNALAIAASNVAGLRANFGSMTKSLHAGQAAEGGLRAATLSARGFTANAGVFDAAGGFFGAYGMELGRRAAPADGHLEIDTSGIGIKPYACCGAGVSLIDAALELHAAHAPKAGDIVAVECLVSDMATRIMPFHAAADGLQAKYCLEYCAAVALLDGKGGPAQFDDGRVTRTDVQLLLERVSVKADPGMASGAGRFGVALSARMRDGRTLTASLELPRGHPNRPLAADQLVAKFLECAVPVLGEARAKEAAARLQDLDRLDRLDPLIDVLCPAEGL